MKNNSMYADNYVKTMSKQQRKYSFEAKSLNEAIQWQEEFRSELIDILGINEIKKRGICDLNPVCVGKVNLDDHIREEWTITSELGYEVPLYVLKPLNHEGPLPLVITPHGHGKDGKKTYVGIANNENEKKDMQEGERDIALQAVREGYIAIAMDQRGFVGTKFQKDIDEDKNNSCRTMQMHALLFGRTLIGERVWDIGRIIDYAKTRSDIDDERIAITGNSGGGTASLFAAAVDTRIKVAMPGSYFCTFEDSIGSVNHCECNYIPGIMTLGEMYDVAGLIAPRPFLAINGIKDSIFPIDAAKRAFNELSKVYEVMESPKACEMYIGDGGHRYYKARAWDFVKEWI